MISSRSAVPFSTLESYIEATRRPVYSLLLVGPLLAVFHVGVAVSGSRAAQSLLVEKFLAFFGVTAPVFAPLLVMVLLGAQYAVHRKRDRTRTRLHAFVPAGMAVESVLYLLPLMAMGYLTRRVLAADTAAQTAPRLWEDLLRAIGAGVYEEFLFRLVLISLAMLVLVDVFELRRKWVLAGAVVVSGLLFSAAHFPFSGIGHGRPFEFSAFLFLAMAGVFWGVLYVTRGFGVAVGSHICWDVYVFLLHAPSA
jgi:membrane protease YdiL (CAAX protease family)